MSRGLSGYRRSDTSVAIRICDSGGNFRALKDSELVAPPLLWSEFTASVHAAVWRGERSAERGRLIELLGGSPVRKRDHVRLLAEAWRLADELGWAKTYDAEYCYVEEPTGWASWSRPTNSEGIRA